ncbi:MAG: FGGY-family carbohydrate kinase, partial [Bacilli bacterium]
NKTGLVSLGTYITSMVMGNHYQVSPNNFFTNFGSVANQYIYESWGIRRGMWTVTWVKDFIGQDIIEKARVSNLTWEEYLNAQAAKITPGSDGLLCILDWLAPPQALHKKGIFIGFDERHTYVHMYRSIIEGIAFTMYTHFTNMVNELKQPIESIIISGGGSNSNLIMQLFADVYGIKTKRNVVNGAAGLGSAICAAVAIGVYPDSDAAIKGMVKIKDEFLPNMENHRIYQGLIKAYNRIPEATEGILKDVYDVLNQQ